MAPVVSALGLLRTADSVAKKCPNRHEESFKEPFVAVSAFFSNEAVRLKRHAVAIVRFDASACFIAERCG